VGRPVGPPGLTSGGGGGQGSGTMLHMGGSQLQASGGGVSHYGGGGFAPGGTAVQFQPAMSPFLRRPDLEAVC